jgi:retron-type reverse transcriptase
MGGKRPLGVPALEDKIVQRAVAVDHECLLQMVAHRIADPRILQLIGLWLRAGVLESGEKQETDRGTPQGAGISPLPANIFRTHTTKTA